MVRFFCCNNTVLQSLKLLTYLPVCSFVGTVGILNERSSFLLYGVSLHRYNVPDTHEERGKEGAVIAKKTHVNLF